MSTLLEVRDLKTYFFTREGVVHAVDGISYSLDRGRTLGIVGESGCGKSVNALSLMRLVPDPPGRIVEGSIMFQGSEIRDLKEKEMQKIRGNDISMIFQDPMTSLNPVLKMKTQLTEGMRLHLGITRREAMERALELFDAVGISDARQRLNGYPHQLSGGMRQRAMIAIALACGPALLIADEPTTALDVTIQAQILDLLRDLQQRFDMSLLLITHDLGTVAGMSDEVIVMYAGKVVEQAPTEELFANPQHPYTEALLASIPRVDEEGKTRLGTVGGLPPDLVDPPNVCRFRPRCRHVTELCRTGEPPLEAYDAAGHYVACWSLRGARKTRVEEPEG